MAEGAFVHVLSDRAVVVGFDEVDRSADGRVGPVRLPHEVDSRVHADEGGIGAAHHHEVRDAVGGGAAGVKVISSVADRRNCRRDHREMLRQAASHHRDDRHALSLKRLAANALDTQNIIRSKAAIFQHC